MNLREYIQRVYILEKNCYEQQILIQKVQSQLDRAKHPKFYASETASSSKASDVVWGIISPVLLAVVGGIIGFVILFILELIGLCLAFLNLFLNSDTINSIMNFLDGPDSNRLLLWFIGGGLIIGLAIGVFQSITSIKDGAKKRRLVAIHNYQAAKENQRITLISENKVKILQEQLTRIKSLYASTSSILRDFYNLNIIFPKYRSLVPISMFYEYLSSGRCSRLDGPDGGYNIYEQELRMNLILNKLDDIIDRLDEIQENQYVLSNMIRDSNRTTQKICDTIVDCSNQLQDINSNTTIAKYYSQISAINTTYMAWFKEFH